MGATLASQEDSSPGLQVFIDNQVMVRIFSSVFLAKVGPKRAPSGGGPLPDPMAPYHTPLPSGTGISLFFARFSSSIQPDSGRSNLLPAGATAVRRRRP